MPFSGNSRYALFGQFIEALCWRAAEGRFLVTCLLHIIVLGKIDYFVNFLKLFVGGWPKAASL